MNTWLRRLIGFGAALLLLGLSLYLSESAFRAVLEFRQLERIPLSQIQESVGGEVQIRGVASEGRKTLTSPRTETKSLYYRYLVEREERDSDGNTSWRTVRDETEATDFFIEDASGKASVLGKRYNFRVNWSVRQKYQQETGSYRYTEWRIDPGDLITVFGWMEFNPDPEVSFPDGDFRPIISSFTAADERADLAFGAILRLWGGVTALVFSCFALVYGLRIHRTLVFLSFISLAGSLLLFHYGYRSVQDDVGGGYNRVESHSERAMDLIRRSFVDRGIVPANFASGFDLNSPDYAALSDREKHQINAWRRSVYQVRERYVAQINRFPENAVATALNRKHPPVVNLPMDELAKVQAAEADFKSTRTQVSPLWSLLMIAFTAVLAWFSFRSIATKRMQENIPTSKTAGVVYGLSEVKGELYSEVRDQLPKGPLSGAYSTWYRYKVEERRGSGKNRSWHTVSDDIVKQPFYCEDEEGRIRIFPSNAEIITKHCESEQRGDMKYTEWRLSPGDELYVMGKARLDKTTGDSLVFGHEKGSPYIIANIPEEDVMLKKAFSGMGLMSVALSALFFGALIIGGSNGQMSSLDFLLASLIAPFFMLCVVIVLMYNDLIFLKQRCDRNWANIQVSLKKRKDLVPQLFKVVKQYLSHEKELQKSLVEMRERWRSITSPGDVDAYMAMEHASIDRISARIEDYPDLEGIDVISDFNGRLIRLENEIALIRAGFNDAVTQYETRLQTFPDNLLAAMFGFKPPSLLKYEAAAHRVPQVRA